MTFSKEKVTLERSCEITVDKNGDIDIETLRTINSIIRSGFSLVLISGGTKRLVLDFEKTEMREYQV